jgi:Kef-type K+ transport system membrane component KefB
MKNSILPDVSIISPTLTTLLLQLFVVIGFCEFLSLLGNFTKQPRVIFEIIAGILLGPSGLGKIPSFESTIFPFSSLGIIGVVANLGLNFYLFIVGLEVDLSVLQNNFVPTTLISLSCIAVPFGLGVAVSKVLYEELENPEVVSFSSYFIFVGTSFSITAFPVLARIIKESCLLLTPAGMIALNAAAINDAVAWVLLVIAISFAKATSTFGAAWLVLSMLAYALFLFSIVRWIFYRLVAYVEQPPFTEKQMIHLFSTTIVLTLFSAWFTSILGMDAIIGSFAFGVIVPRKSKLYSFCLHNIENFAATFFLPIYFVYSGLRTDFSVLQAYPDLLIIILVIVVATFGKVIGAGIPSLLCGFSFRQSCVIAILMNTRGLIELIVLNIGVEAGILSTRSFSILVIMCLFTTFISYPLVRLIYYDEIRQAKLSRSRFRMEDHNHLNLEATVVVETPREDNYEHEVMNEDTKTPLSESETKVFSTPDSIMVRGNESV